MCKREREGGRNGGRKKEREKWMSAENYTGKDEKGGTARRTALRFLCRWRYVRKREKKRRGKRKGRRKGRRKDEPIEEEEDHCEGKTAQ